MYLDIIKGIIIGILLVVALYYIIIYLAKKFPTKESKLRFCPRCGRQNISANSKSFALMGGSIEYYCRDCELKSVLFPIAKDEIELKRIQKKLKSKKYQK